MRLPLPFQSDTDPSRSPGPGALVSSRAASGGYQQSRGIGEVLARLESLRRPNVLELGAPDPRNFAAYHDRGAAISVADLYRFGVEGRAPDAPLEVERLLPSRSAPFDVVLAWDLLDYLGRDDAEALLAAARARVSPQALILILAWSEERIPATPSHYSIVDETRLQRTESSPRQRVAPRYSEHGLLGLAPLQLERRSILRHGAVEYVLSFCL